jgi:hypothetical protein
MGETDLFGKLSRLFQNTYHIYTFLISQEGIVIWNKNVRIPVIFYFTGWCSVKCCSTRIGGGI